MDRILYTVGNFYVFTPFSGEELTELQATWEAELTRREAKGTVLLAPEGLNASLQASPAALQDFALWVRRDPRFASLQMKLSTGYTQPFAHLEVRQKRWIIRFAEAQDPSVDAVQKGGRTSPAAMKTLLQERPQDVVVIDTRNDYETDYGRFAGAVSLPIRAFTEFPDQFEQRFGDAKDKHFVMYCTGGIRCEKAVAWAQARGFSASQLDGGILGYFDEEGGAGYEGSCVVFDNRWLVNPSLTEAEDEPGRPRIQPKARG